MRRRFLILSLLSLLLFFADRRKWLSGVKSIVVRPFLGAERQIYLLSKGLNRSQELAILRQEVSQFALNQNELTNCLVENEKVKKTLGVLPSTKTKLLAAPVAGNSDKMRIIQGEKEGVKKGMMVISENILVGQVVDTGDHESLVKLVTDSDSKIPVVVKRSTTIQAKGLLLGMGGQSLMLDKILQEEDVQRGDLVVTTGENNFLPNLLIGQIEEILPKTAEVFRQAKVRPLYTYQDLDTVFVVLQ